MKIIQRQFGLISKLLHRIAALVAAQIKVAALIAFGYGTGGYTNDVIVYSELASNLNFWRLPLATQHRARLPVLKNCYRIVKNFWIDAHVWRL